MAGVGGQFKALARTSAGVDVGAYMAGLWQGDLRCGIMWGPAWQHLGVPNRKASGFERCEVLRRPAVQVAPSWSWASVDGHIVFFGRDSSPKPWHFDVVGIDMACGLDNLMAERPLGILTIRGLLAQMRYLPAGHGEEPDHFSRAQGHNVGSLVFEENDPDDTGSRRGFSGAMLDFDRDLPRDCWAMVAFGSGTSFNGYILLERRGPHFARIGFCDDQTGSTPNMLRFREMVITLI